MPENSRKTLWLAAAVSLFTLIVVGAAFLFFAPGKTGGEAPFDMSGKAEQRQEAPQDYLADAPAENLTTQTTSGGDIIIVYGNEPAAQTTPAAEAPQKPATTTIVVGPSTATTVKPAAAVPATTTTTVKPATIAKSTTTTTAKAATTTKAPAKVEPAAAPAAGDYWIQAGSFSVKDNADALKAAFLGKSLPAVITVRDIDGKSRYNVRVGPYPSRAEANKWLSAVKSVKGAEQSWITQ